MARKIAMTNRMKIEKCAVISVALISSNAKTTPRSVSQRKVFAIRGMTAKMHLMSDFVLSMSVLVGSSTTARISVKIFHRDTSAVVLTDINWQMTRRPVCPVVIITIRTGAARFAR